jgi:putative heme-binding domain-containing protein
VPNGWTYKPFPDLAKLNPDSLVKGLNTESATTRLATQQEILTRGDKSLAPAILAIAKEAKNPLAARVAATFTYKQLLGAEANTALLELAADSALTEFALRAAADRLKQNTNLPLAPFQKALTNTNPRAQAAAAVALGRIGKKEAAESLLAVARPPVSTQTPTAAPKPPLFESANLTDKESVDIEISLVGVNNLYLVVEEGGNGNGGDHGGWFDPILTNREGKEIPLTQLKWKSATQGWGKTEINKSPTGAPLLRADGKPHTQGIGTHSHSVIHYVIPGAMQKLKVTAGLCSTHNPGATVNFRILAEPPAGTNSKEGPHATPNPAVIIPHLAIHSLVSLKAIEQSLAAVDSVSSDGALRTLHLIHDPAVVDGLLAKHSSTSDPELKNKILTALARLYTREAAYDGSWWWGTQPDTRGPYYKPILWTKSADIEKRFRDVWATADNDQKAFLTMLANKHRMNLEGIGEVEKTGGKKEKTIGEISIEDIMLTLDKMKGDPNKGRELMKTQACAACHSVADADPKRGPDLNKIGASLNREAIAEAILKPDAAIAKSWVDVTTNDGTTHQGTLVEKSDTQIIVRNIAGIPTTLKPADVKEIKTSASTLMGPHLLDALTMEQFADVISYLHSLK